MSGFRIYQSDSTLTPGTFVALSDLTASTFAYTDTTVKGGHQYQYYFTSYNVLGGESEKSLILTVTPA